MWLVDGGVVYQMNTAKGCCSFTHIVKLRCIIIHVKEHTGKQSQAIVLHAEHTQPGVYPTGLNAGEKEKKEGTMQS